MGRKLTTEEFIEKAQKIHADRYGYDLVKYKNAKTKVKIKCKKHGMFKQTPDSHLRGSDCRKCKDYDQKLTNDSFIKKAKIIHGNKYDYSLIGNFNIYDKIKIVCKKHGIFEQTLNAHLYQKHGCLICAGNIKLTTEDFIERARKVHGNKYDYSLVDYKNTTIKINIICKKCGIVFKQIPNSHLGGRGCSRCNISKGENDIEQYLKEYEIKYETQKIFNKCKNKRQLPFDFYLSEHNTCVEYDGKQHYKPIKHFGGQKSFEYLQKCDAIKNKYCKDNNIKLVRIPYTEFKNINKILQKELL